MVDEFVVVARTEAIPPGQRLVVEVGRDWVVIFNIDGEFYAIEDQCSHDAVSLSEGGLYGCEIECSQHGARFDVRTGAHLSPPALTGVKAYIVQVVDGEVQIGRRGKRPPR